MIRYELTRSELREKCADDFPDKCVVVCGKYFIWIKYGEYEHAGLCTTVSTTESLIDIPMHKHPKYVYDFIHRRKGLTP